MKQCNNCYKGLIIKDGRPEVCPKCQGQGFIFDSNEEFMRGCTRDALIAMIYHFIMMDVKDFCKNPVSKEVIIESIDIWLKGNVE